MSPFSQYIFCNETSWKDKHFLDFLHSVRYNFITFITSRVARDTKHVIDGLYTARLKNKVMLWEKCTSSFNIWIASVFSVWNHCMKVFFCRTATLKRNTTKQRKRMTVWKCKEIICSTKCDMHWKTHDCNGKWTCLKRISTSFVFLVKIKKRNFLST